MKNFITEFKAFAIKGNVMDLAVAVIIGTAFGKIVSSLVDAVIMPAVGILLGGINFSGLSFTFGATAIKYGVFLQSIVDFLIIALIVFLVIKGLEHLKKAEAAAGEEKPVVIPEDVRLLTEIRDLLQKK